MGFFVTAFARALAAVFFVTGFSAAVLTAVLFAFGLAFGFGASLAFLAAAHRFFSAAMILARPAALIRRFRRGTSRVTGKKYRSSFERREEGNAGATVR